MVKKTKFKNLIKSNKGFTMQDLIIATLIITIFVEMCIRDRYNSVCYLMV